MRAGRLFAIAATLLSAGVACAGGQDASTSLQSMSNVDPNALWAQRNAPAPALADADSQNLYDQQQARIMPVEQGEPAAWHRSQAELENIQKAGARHSSGIMGTIGSYINPTEAEQIDAAKNAYGLDWAKVYNEQTKGQDIEHATQGQILEGMPVAGGFVEKTPAMQFLDENSHTTPKINRAWTQLAERLLSLLPHRKHLAREPGRV